LLQQAVEGDRASVESRWRARLQPADGQLEFTQLCRERFRGRITGPARLVVLEADVDQSGQESTGGQHDGIGFEPRSELGHHAADSITDEGQIVDSLLEQRQVGLVFEARPNRLLVQQPVGLRSRGAYCRTLAQI
jgi:hypothetical protein